MTDGSEKSPLSNDDLRDAMADNGHQLTAEQLQALVRFLKQAGSLEHAEAAIAELQQHRDAA